MLTAKDFSHLKGSPVYLNPNTKFSFQRRDNQPQIGKVIDVYNGSYFRESISHHPNIWVSILFPDGYENNYPLECVTVLSNGITNQSAAAFLDSKLH